MLSLFFTFFVALVPRAQAESEIFTEAPLAPNPTRYEFKVQFDFLSTNHNYPSGGGSAIGLYNGGKYSAALGMAQLSYDINRYFRIYGGVNGGRADATSPDVNDANMSSSHTTSFDETWVGMQAWYRRHAYSVVPQLDFTYPLFKVSPDGDDPLLGEGATKATAGVWVQLHFSGITPFGYGGYQYRDGGRSSLLRYRLGIRYRQAGAGWVQGELRGYSTLMNDSNTINIVQREAYLNHVDGGSFEFYSTNPSHGEAALSGGFEIGDIGLYAAGAISAFGHESASDFTITAGITIGGKLFTNPDALEREDRFQTPTKDYDEKLFRENDERPVVAPMPADENDIPEIKRKPAPPPPKPRRRIVRPGTDTTPSPDVELIMKDTEKALEKKAPK